MNKRMKEIEAELNTITERRSAIKAEAETADKATLESNEKELNDMATREKSLLAEKAEIEKREQEAKDIGAGTVHADEIEKPAERGKKMEKNTIEYRSTKEYRDAFYRYLTGNDTVEDRDALITTGTSGIALPAQMDTQIWDNIHTEHPITADVTTLESGVVLEVTRHTSITAGKAKKTAEGKAPDAEDNAFVTVSLSGNDYSKYVELSYAAAKMTQGALEKYLVSEISADIGEALAADIFAKIEADAKSGNVVTLTADLTYKDLTKALGSVKGTGVTVYCSRSTDYGKIMGMVDINGQPIFRDGVGLKSAVKEDDAAGDNIYVVDPSMFLLNVVQGLMIEDDRDIKAHKLVYSGYCRAQGTLRDDRAAAVIKPKATA